ncbi:MAG TPA: hypothetical protein VIJ78_04970 [Pseudolabrys sp.]|jgi:hypothetical protein
MMKLNILTLALAASALCSFAANAQTVIEERRAPAVVIEHDQPQSSVTVKEHGGFLGATTKTTTETNGVGINGDCSSRTVHKDGIGIDKTVSKTNCE